MRFSKITLVAAGLLLLCASTANAYALRMSLSPDSDSPTNVTIGNMIIVDVYLDAPTQGLEFLGVPILWDADGLLVYSPADSSMPSYILYTGGKGATYLIPNVNPPFIWSGNNQPGKQQVNLEYLEFAFNSAAATGNNIWIGTIAFEIASVADGTSTIDMTLLSNGTAIVQANSINLTSVTPTTGQVVVPEPSAVLAGIAAVSAVFLLRGRRQRV